jgi:hypothetical protein
MSIEHQTTPVFTPVVITLESQEEVNRLYQLFRIAHKEYEREHSMAPADDFLEAIKPFVSD